MLSFEGGSSRSHYVEEPFWKRRWTCRQTDYWMNEWITLNTVLTYFSPSHTHYIARWPARNEKRKTGSVNSCNYTGYNNDRMILDLFQSGVNFPWSKSNKYLDFRTRYFLLPAEFSSVQLYLNPQIKQVIILLHIWAVIWFDESASLVEWVHNIS